MKYPLVLSEQDVALIKFALDVMEDNSPADATQFRTNHPIFQKEKCNG